MTKKYTTKHKHDASPEEVLGVFLSPRFLREREVAQGAVDAEIEELESTQDHVVLKLHATEYGRTMTGGLDKSKREKSSTTYHWDIKKMKGEWTYQGTHGDKIKVSGVFTITPTDQGGSMVTSDFQVDVGIPLLGKKIEKMIIKEIEKSTPISARVLREFLNKQN
jgi:hypothetical protein